MANVMVKMCRALSAALHVAFCLLFVYVPIWTLLYALPVITASHPKASPTPARVLTPRPTGANAAIVRDNFSDLYPHGKYEIHCYTLPEHGKPETTCIAVKRKP